MSNRELRQMKKSKGTRPKQETGRTFSPGRSDGVAGDIRIRQTDRGPMIEAKLGNEWYQSALTPVNAAASVIIPKVYYITGVTLGSAGSQWFYMPEGINNNNIIAINFGISLGSGERTYFNLGDAGITSGYKMFVHYRKNINAVRLEIFSGVSVQGKEFTLSVFYK